MSARVTAWGGRAEEGLGTLVSESEQMPVGCASTCGRLAPCASARMEPYHDRMSVLVEAKDSDSWLDGSLGVGALKPAPEEALRERTVSLRLNRSRVGDDNPTIIAPIKAD